MFRRIVDSKLASHLIAAGAVALVSVIAYLIIISVDVTHPVFGLFFSSLNRDNSGRGPASTLNYARISNMVRSGKGVVIFGSSELSTTTLSFAPYNYLPTSCHIPVIAYGQAQYQTLGMYGLLSSLQRDLSPRSKIVIFISPSWFDKGDMLPQAFSLHLTDQILYRDYWKSEARQAIGAYLEEHKNDFGNLTDAQKLYISGLTYPNLLLDALIKPLEADIYYARWKLFTYRYPGVYPGESATYPADESYQCNLHAMHAYEPAAQATELALMTDNHRYVRNDYFDRILKDKNLPPKGLDYLQPQMNSRPELQDMRLLLDLLHRHGVQPFLITLPLNPYVYDDSFRMKPVSEEISNLCKQYKAICMDMGEWPYTPGLLQDAVHPGELGFLKIDEMIYEYFRIKT